MCCNVYSQHIRNIFDGIFQPFAIEIDRREA